MNEDTRFNEFIAGFEGELAREYATVRPHYPKELFEWLASVSPGNASAWDVGTGTGQVAAPLGEHFDHVFASDTNPELLAKAQTHSDVEYVSWPAENPELGDASLDLITSGMAAHWFDLPVFYENCRRVLRPRGVIAIFGFYFFHVNERVDSLIHEWYGEKMTAYEFPELTMLREGYEKFSFPFEQIQVDRLTGKEVWTFEQITAFLAQWIVVKRARQAGEEVLRELFEELYVEWGEGAREITWPIFMRATRM